MKVTKRQLKKIIREERQKLVKEGFYPEEHGVPDAHSSEEKQLQQLKKRYPGLNDYFDGGWDEEGGRYGHGAWVVMDETEGRFVDTGVSIKGQLGKYIAWDSVNSSQQRDIKANRMAASEMGWVRESRNNTLNENYSYKPKADALKSAIAALQSAAEYERRNSDVGEDEFLEEIITDLQNYLSSVLPLLDWEKPR